MVVGPTGGGKSENIRVLSEALTVLKLNGIKGHLYEKIKHFVMNPKAITMGQLYGEFDPNTREFIDGQLPCLYRKASADTQPDRKFVTVPESRCPASPSPCSGSHAWIGFPTPRP